MIPARAEVRLELDPDPAEILLGGSQDYTATLVIRVGPYQPSIYNNPDTYTYRHNVTGWTRFVIRGDRACKRATCTPTKAGEHTVVGSFPRWPRWPKQIHGTAVLHVEPVVASLQLQPDPARILLGRSQVYTVEGFAADGSPIDLDQLTAKPALEIDQGGTCTGTTCTPAKVGTHTVKVTLTQQDRAPITAAAVLQVEDRSSGESKPGESKPGESKPGESKPGESTATISSVTPGFTPPNRPVEVRGTTGSCSRAGTLTLHRIPDDVSVHVTGDQHGNFVATFTVPGGTFPNAYKLELTVDCNSQVQRAEGELTVINLAPVAVDDAAATSQDTPVAIAVTANDRNPDPDTGYPTLVLEHGSPANGTIQVQPDGIIIYTPHAGFLGQDQFQYDLCDNVINAAGTADCGLATVVVTVNPTIGGSAGGGSTNPNPCVPSAGDLRQHLQVTPVKGPGGTRLRITAQLDPKLAACRLRLLLGGAPLGPDLSVGMDGSVAAQPAVPPNVIPGSNVLRLATTGGQVLDQTSFEILPALLRRWWERNPYRLLLGVGALLGGALARATLRRLRRLLQDEDRHDLARRYGLRADPHSRPHEVTVAPDIEDRPTLVVRLQPHGDAGTLTLQEVPG